MSNRSKQRAKRVGKPVDVANVQPNAPAACEAPSLAASLPLPPVETALAPPPSRPLLKEDSPVREKALKIVAYRLAGMDDTEIGRLLNLSPKSLSAYLYRAGKSGFLDELNSAKEAIENQLLPKAIRNLDEALDSTDPRVRRETALEIAKGTTFKTFGESAGGQLPSNQLTVQILNVPGAPTVVRPESGGGTPAYVEAELTNGDS